ncbi:MAG: hypothetical protein RLZZ142_470, partial [Verrucomicrobiota bacterium]
CQIQQRVEGEAGMEGRMGGVGREEKGGEREVGGGGFPEARSGGKPDA